jgi:hypothetical protein
MGTNGTNGKKTNTNAAKKTKSAAIESARRRLWLK